MATSADAAFAEALTNAGVATLHEAAGRRGLCQGLRLLVGPSFAGRAVTAALPAGDNLGIHAALATAPSGSVICAASRGGGHFGVIGELIATAARPRRIAAFVIDDGIRDLELLEPPPSIAARSVTAQGTVKRRYLSLGEAVGVAGVLVRPDDWVVGDSDGVCVIPSERLEEVLRAAGARAAKEDEMRQALAAGESSVDLLGLAELIERSRSRS